MNLQPLANAGRNPVTGKKALDAKTLYTVAVLTRLLNLWFSTCRVEIHGRRLHERYISGDRKVIGATWHRGAIFLLWFYRRAHPIVMFSRSRDGELLAEFARRLGIIPIRGSSKHGGREALDGMKLHLRRQGDTKVATVLDGPSGPRYVAKKGMLVLAKETDVPLLPIMVSAHPAITVKHAWDKTIIPLPFSRVVVTYRNPWHIPRDVEADGLEHLRLEVEETLNEMRRAADRYTGYIEKSGYPENSS